MHYETGDKSGEEQPDSKNPLRLDYGFIMDDVASVQNLSSHNKIKPKMYFYPDPHFVPFLDPGGVKV